MRRMTHLRKLGLVRAYQDGHDIKKQLKDENVSLPEFLDWLRLFNLYGAEGLKVTKIQKVKKLPGNWKTLGDACAAAIEGFKS